MKEEVVHIPADSVELEGNLAIPAGSNAIVVFAHGSGSSRFSPRNRYVAEKLRGSGIGTLLFDLLTKKEDTIYENRFDIPLLTQRLEAATIWLKKQPQTKDMNIGYFSASTGTAAALRAAADLELFIGAIVSRGGRPDLTLDALPFIIAPTLFIVGGLDHVVLQLNRKAFEIMKVKKN